MKERPFILLFLAVLLALLVLAIWLRWPPWVAVSIGTIGLVSFLFVLHRLLSPQRSSWFWGGLLGAAILLYVWSLSYQAGAPAQAQQYRAWASPQLANTPGNLRLVIAYPRVVPLEAPDKAGWPLSVYLWPPVVPITPTVAGVPPSATSGPTVTPPVGETATLEVTGTARAAVPVSATSTPTSMPTQVISYTVAFLPYDDGVLFTDDKGVPVSSQVVVGPGQSPDKPAVLYLRRALTGTVRASVPITVQVYGLDGVPNDLTTLNVELEEGYHAWWRHFWDLLFGPATPLLALAATLIGFGWQWWQESEKHKWQMEQEEERRKWEAEQEEARRKWREDREERVTRRERLAEIEQVRWLTSQDKLQEAVEKLLETSHKVEHEWDSDNELVARLTQVRQELERHPWRQRLYQQGMASLSKGEPNRAADVARLVLKLDPDFSAAADLQRAAEMLQAFRDGPDEWLRTVDQMGVELAIATLARIGREYAHHLELVLAELLAGLAGRAEYVEVTLKHVREDWALLDLLNQPPFHEPSFTDQLQRLKEDDTAPRDARNAAGELLALVKRPYGWPDLWPNQRPPDPPAIVEWLGQVGLSFNPFGPERAEEDPLLPRLFVRPAGWEIMKAPEPTLVFGAMGDGRTASVLLLARTCTTTPLGVNRSVGDIDTLPTRLTLFLEGRPEEISTTWWRMLTRAVAAASLDFLARNPQAFARTPSRQQRALARLFAMHRDYLGDSAGYLEAAGLDDVTAERVLEDIRKAARGTRPPVLADEADLLATLGEAFLSPFQQHYVLAEVPDNVCARLSPQEVVEYLETPLQTATSLAERKVYVKLFLPAVLRSDVEPVAPWINGVGLIWDERNLGEMLESRVQQAGAASFKALFRHLPQGIDPGTRLVQAALESEGSPRRLIQLGQALIVEHIRRAQEGPAFPGPKLRWEELKAVLEQ